MAAGSVQEFYTNRANEQEVISDRECLRQAHLYFVINKGKDRIKSAMASKSKGIDAQAARDALLKEAGVDVASGRRGGSEGPLGASGGGVWASGRIAWAEGSPPRGQREVGSRGVVGTCRFLGVNAQWTCNYGG